MGVHINKWFYEEYRITDKDKNRNINILAV